MSRIHAFLIALLVTGAVAVGAATAFTVANEPAKAGTALSSAVLQARADKINKAEKKLAKDLKNNPRPDRTPIVKTITVNSGGSGGGGGSFDDSGHHTSSPSTPAPTVSRHHDDDDDHGDDHGEDHGDDDHGSDD